MNTAKLINRIAELRKREYDDDFTEEDEDLLGELQGERYLQQLAEIPAPTCCAAMMQFQCVYMHIPWDEENDKHGTENPEWRTQKLERVHDPWEAPPAKFCPYCGKRLPLFVKRDPKDVPKPLMAHGPHYCETCGERNQECTCHPHETIYELRYVR